MNIEVENIEFDTGFGMWPAFISLDVAPKIENEEIHHQFGVHQSPPFVSDIQVDGAEIFVLDKHGGVTGSHVLKDTNKVFEYVNKEELISLADQQIDWDDYRKQA
jgi:hypothetical protein